MEANENTNTDIDVMDKARLIGRTKKQKVIYQRSSS